MSDLGYTPGTPDLFETINTKPDNPVEWISVGDHHAAFFTVNGVKFSAYVDEINVDGKKVIDVGFKKEGAQDITNVKNVSSGKVFGAVVNTLVPFIREINPDMVSVVVMKNSGNVESRMGLYGSIINRIHKLIYFEYGTHWYETTDLFYMLMSKNPITKEQKEEIVNKIKSKDV